MFRIAYKLVPPSMKDTVKKAFRWLPAEWHYGKTYKNWVKFLKEAQYWPMEKIEEWQLLHFKQIVRYAYENTSGYKDLMMSAGVRPDDIKSLKDVKLLPFTTKEMFRDRLVDFSVKNITCTYQTTGGSTGIPLGFYETWQIPETEDAFMHHGWSSVGWIPEQLNAVLRGAFVGSVDSLWKLDAYRRELLLSSYYLTRETLDQYVGVIHKFRPRVLQAYPSSAVLLCDLLLETGRVGDINFDLILLGSENIYKWVLTKIGEVFPQAEVMAWYGHAERAILAPWCKDNHEYHVWPFYGMIEVLNDSNEEVGLGEEGEIVGTSFQMRATPFIRYRTMDIARKGCFGCKTCGREFQLLEDVVGRCHDFILTSSGRRLSIAALNMHNEVYDHIRQFQFVQEKQGHVVFKIVKKESFRDDETEKIRRELKKKLGHDLELDIVFVNSIERTNSGKFCFLDQRMNFLSDYCVERCDCS